MGAYGSRDKRLARKFSAKRLIGSSNSPAKPSPGCRSQQLRSATSRDDRRSILGGAASDPALVMFEYATCHRDGSRV